MAALHTPEFWVAIGFIVLVLAISKKGWEAIRTGLDDRAERIRTGLDEATRLREEAQHLLAEYQRKQRDAAKEIDNLLAAARAEAERSTVNAREALEASVKRREQLAIDKIAQAEADVSSARAALLMQKAQAERAASDVETARAAFCKPLLRAWLNARSSCHGQAFTRTVHERSSNHERKRTDRVPSSAPSWA